MPSSSLSTTLHAARTDWLGGDAEAWSRYADCCRRLSAACCDATPHCPSHTAIPNAWLRPPDFSSEAPRQ